MTLLSLCGVAITAALAACLLKEFGGKLSPLLTASGGLLLVILVLSRYGELFRGFLSFADAVGLSDVGGLLIKILAIAYLASLAADICRDLGEGALGTRVEWCAKAEILLLCLPKFKELTEYALGLIEGI